jgi:predicted enzyme involved in methoxymalonyl-ACP biosynthesis
MVATVSPISEMNLGRARLINKSNQFNLTTIHDRRRDYTIARSNWATWTISLKIASATTV